MEVYPNHLQAAAKLMGRKPAELKEIFTAADVHFTSYGVSGFSKDEKKNREVFDLAKAYGLKTISADPDDNKETFDLLEKLTEEYGVAIAIHPHGPGHKWGKVDQLKKAFDGRSNRIGLCADTGHLIRSGESPLDVIKLFKDRTHSLHLKDFKRLDPTKDKWEDVPAGDASLDVDGIVKYLIAEKWPGHIYIEYEGKEPVPAIQKSVARVKQAVTKANG
ncbi:MAG TPA: TIM barrel protein, partial [Humisphaera sp.]